MNVGRRGAQVGQFLGWPPARQRFPDMNLSWRRGLETGRTTFTLPMYDGYEES